MTNKNNMMIRNIVLIVTFCSFLLTNETLSQPVDASRKVLVKTYSINNQDYEFKNNVIVLSTSDSVSFFYGLATDNNSPKDAFLFRVTLSTSNDSSVYNTGQNVISYKGLNEGRYKLSINAFDLQRRWSAVANEVIFEVDNVKAKLMKELDSLRNAKNQPAIKDTVMKSENHSIFTEKWFIYLIIFLFLGAILLLFILTKNLINFKKLSMNSNKKGQVIMDMNNFKSKDEYEKLAFENSELRAEIAALRGQIDAMTLRSEQLSKQNKELQTSVAKLTKSKNELEELQKQKDELFAVVIHDIKNPAALIKSLVELLTSYDLTASEQQEIINDIALTTSKIVTLSQEVSKILSIEGTKINLNIESADVNDIVKDVFQRNTIAARNKSINIFTDLMERLPNADIDPQKIDEVIDNLVYEV